MAGVLRNKVTVVGSVAVLLAGLSGVSSVSANDQVPLRNVAAATVVSTIKPLGFPATAISPDGNLAVFVSVADQTLTTLNLASGESQQLSSLGSYPWDVSISPTGDIAYVMLLQDEEIVAVDTRTLVILARTKFAEYAGSGSFALSPDGSRAYIANTRAFLPPNPATNELIIVDLISGTVEASIPLGSTLTRNALLQPGKRVAAPSGSSLVFVADHLAGGVQVVDPSARSVARFIPFDGEISSIAVSNDGSKVVVLSKGKDVVTLLDGVTGANLWESSTYPGSPGGAVIDEADGSVYVTLEYTGTLLRFDLGTGSPERRNFSSMQLGAPALVENGRTIAIPVTPTSVLLLQPEKSQKESSVRLPAPQRVKAQWKNGAVNVFWLPTLGDGFPPADSFTVTTQPKSSVCRSERNNCVFTNLTPGDTYRFVVTAQLGDEKSKSTRSRLFTVPD